MPRWPALVSLGARLVLALVWLWAGLAKAQDPGEAVRAVRAFDVLPEALVPVVGRGLPFLEIGLGLLLLVGLAVRAAAVASGLLLTVFVAGVSQAWARGLSIDCGCFGGGGQVAAGQTRYLQEVLRDLGFLALAGWLVVRPSSPLSVDRFVAGPESEVVA